ncbi:hypothetical protein [Rhizobium sp. RAF56]|jgi:hypothetical protein|uniref:hypothetical protein n=1 Tax=Rhizobium sp. RAF56 TaxID=3233062 RepID=UPI003F9DF94A
MLSQETAAQPRHGRVGAKPAADKLPVELLELELSLEGFEGGEEAFCDAVRKTATAADGEFLFDLPAAGLVADCRRIGVIRVPDGAGDMRVMLACLNGDGAEIHLQEPDEETEHLVRFADAFVDVLKRMPEREREHN